MGGASSTSPQQSACLKRFCLAISGQSFVSAGPTTKIAPEGGIRRAGRRTDLHTATSAWPLEGLATVRRGAVGAFSRLPVASVAPKKAPCGSVQASLVVRSRAPTAASTGNSGQAKKAPAPRAAGASGPAGGGRGLGSPGPHPLNRLDQHNVPRGIWRSRQQARHGQGAFGARRTNGSTH
jgi:hypothetical protein